MLASVWNNKPHTNRLRNEYTMSGSHCITIMNMRLPMIFIMVASTGRGNAVAGHHMWLKMLTEKDVETMQEAAMNMKKYLGENRSVNTENTQL
jgi:hypothetical protein